MFAKFSVKKPYTVIVGIILVIALGYISFTHMTTDLLPSMDLPYAIVYTTYTGATPESVESTVTRPLEGAFSTLTDIKNVTSTSRENLSLVVLEFASGADMNTAMIEINSEIDQVVGGWDDSIGTPVIMKLNPDMLPVMVSTVSLDDADLLELSDYVEDTLVPAYETVNGVARVTPSGIMTQQVDITIEQSRIDALNSAILREVDDKLADVEDQLRDAMSQLSSGKSQLSRMKKKTLAQIDEGIAAVDSGAAGMTEAIAAMEAQKAQLEPQLTAAREGLAQLEQLINLPEEQKAQMKQVADGLAALEAQRDGIQAQIDALPDEPDSEQAQRLAQLQSEREQQAQLKAAQQQYIEDLQLLSTDALEETIAGLKSDISENESELAGLRSELEDAITKRDELQRSVNDLESRIAALEPTEAPEETPAAEEKPAAEDTPAPEKQDDASAERETEPAEQDEAPAEQESAPEGQDSAPAEEASEQAAENPTEAPEMPKPETQKTEAPAPEKTQEAVQDTTKAPETDETQQAFSLFGRTAYAEELSIDELKAELALAREQLASAQADVDDLSEKHDSLRETLNEQNKALEEAEDALALMDGGEIAVQSRIEAAQKQIEDCDRRIGELDAEIEALQSEAAGGSEREQLEAQLAALNGQISAFRESDAYKAYLMMADESALNEKYAMAQGAVSQLEAGIASIDAMLDKLNRGIIPGGMIEGIDEDTDMKAARAQLTSARSMAVDGFAEASSKIADAEGELAEAWDEFIKNRDEALENAGIDGIITVQTVSGILGAQNLDLPAGYVSDDEGRYLVSVGNEFSSLAELKQTKLFSLGLESVDDVRLLDVASVEISDNSADLFTLVNGENGIMLSFEKQSTASTAEVAKAITAKSEKLMAENDKLHVVEMMNQGDYISLVVNSVLDNLVQGGALAILVLLLFLMDWRPTLIVAISIPASVVVAFVCMYFCNISLNVMSLSGLAMGVGMLVDNSIVSIENIYRLRDEEGLPILTSCIRGVNQVAGALFASTLTTICVFLPVVFVTGIARDLFSDMGLTIAFSLLASLLVAMTVVPSFSATLFRHSKPKRHRVFEKIQKGYCAILRGVLRVRWLIVLLALALLGYSAYQVLDMPISFMPSVNSEQMSASLTFEDSEMTEKEQQAAAVEIMNRIMETEGVNDVSLSAGGSMSLMGSMGGGGSYSYYILVEAGGERTNADVAGDIREKAADIADGESIVFTVQESTMDMTAFMGSGISIDIAGSDIASLRQAADEIAAICAQVEGAENIDDGSEAAEPKLAISVDKELASDNSLTVAQVYQYIAQRLYGAVKLTDATLDGREFTLYVSEDKNENITPEELEDMEIEVSTTGSTKYVRIGDIADISEGESLASIRRDNQKRMVSVSFSIAEGYSANLVNRDLEALLKDYQPPEDCELSLSGENEEVMGYMGDLLQMMAIAILFIFLIMVAQFQSFKSPLIVMFTIPLAFTGGLLALIVTKTDLSIIALLGFLVLSGLIVNNGIVFIDSVNQLRIGGMKKRDALIETGRIRLRPILMTTLTTILGMSTMALGSGMGAEMMQPMAIVIIGGLTYATLMTLFVVPALYDIFNGETMRAREIEMIKESAGMKREGFDDDEPVRRSDSGTAEKARECAEAAEAVKETAHVKDEAPVKAGSAPVPATKSADRARRITIKL